MAKKKNTIPSGFDDILGNIYSNAEGQQEVTNIDDIAAPDTTLDDLNNNEPPVKTEDGNEKQDDTSNTTEDTSDIPPEVVAQMNNNKDTTTEQTTETPDTNENNEVTDADVIEAQQVGLLFDAVGQSLGWNMSDIDEKDRPLTVDDLTNYLAETVRQNSVPEYADDRIQQLDAYVKNGGKFEDFYKVQQ